MNKKARRKQEWIKRQNLNSMKWSPQPKQQRSSPVRSEKTPEPSSFRLKYGLK
jgi:hypothetical protein